MEAGCQMFLIYLVSWFFRFDIPRISLDIPSISFPIPISLSEKPDIMFTFMEGEIYGSGLSNVLDIPSVMVFSF